MSQHNTKNPKEQWHVPTGLHTTTDQNIHRVIQQERSLFLEVIVKVIVGKKFQTMNNMYQFRLNNGDTQPRTWEKIPGEERKYPKCWTHWNMAKL